MASKTETHEGGCTCRQVRYRMTSRPLFVHCCHCRWCQRETGAAFALNAIIEADRVELLKKLIREEDPANPLSDSRIAELLSGAGIPVARRTVAKYRESMRLAPSNERRRDAGKLTSHAT